MNYFYVIPPVSFFSGGRGGAVSHAVGLFEGLAEHALIRPLIDGGVGAQLYFSESQLVSNRVKPRGQGALSDLANALSIILFYSKISGQIIHIRKNWAIVVCGLFLLFKIKKISKNNKLIFEINGLSFEGKSGFFNRIFFKLFLHVTARVIDSADVIYVVACGIKEDLVLHAPRLGRKIIVVPNGSPNYIGDKQAYRSGVNIVFFGKFRAYNEYKILKDAFDKYKKNEASARLFIVGFGPEEQEIKRLLHDCHNAFIFGPHSLRELKSSGYFDRAITIGVVPLSNKMGSSYLSPIKLFDYFALGWPVIVSDAVGLDEALLNSSVVAVYKSGDSDSLKDAFVRISQLCKTNEEIFDVVRNIAVQNSWQQRATELLVALDLSKK